LKNRCNGFDSGITLSPLFPALRCFCRYACHRPGIQTQSKLGNAAYYECSMSTPGYPGK
jgi:hypothetical protein